MNKKQIDRRHFYRISVRRSIDFWPVGRDALPHIEGKTVDLSAGGALITSGSFDDEFLDVLIKNGNFVQLHIHLEEGDFAFSCKSKVVWIDPTEDGFLMRVCFLDLGSEELTRIHDFIDDTHLQV